MRMKLAGLLVGTLYTCSAFAQGTVPTFTHTTEGKTYTMVGGSLIREPRPRSRRWWFR